jgi:hypothetical protein
LSIRKPDSSNFQVSSSAIPYFALLDSTSVNHGQIIAGSLQTACWQLYGQLHCVYSSGICLMNLSIQFLPVGLPLHSLSSLSVISCICSSEGSMLHRDLSNTRYTITSSSSFVGFFVYGLRLYQEHCPVRWSTSILQDML